MYPIGNNVIHRDLSDTAVIERKVSNNNNTNIVLIPLFTTPTTIPITMSVKLIWITPAAEHQIEYCARVSNPKGQQTLDTTGKLLRYLVKHKHWSPFEMASACFEINTTRDISAQILRHRSFSFQEFSQRYAEVQQRPELPQWRRQDTANRQNSINDLDLETIVEADQLCANVIKQSTLAYQRLLELGIAKECARKVLPMNSPTRLYMSGTIRSWIHYLQVRRGPETQVEHRVVAEEINRILNNEMPNLWEVVN
jgi:thymidylate synthase (FAD)